MKVVLAKGQERGGVETALFRLRRIITRPTRACDSPHVTVYQLALADRSSTGYACQASDSAMPLSPPFSLRLTQEQIQWLDAWSGDTMSRGTAIRLLIAEAIRLHRDGILPRTARRDEQ